MGKNHLTRVPRESLVPLKYLKILDFTENRIDVIEQGDFVGKENRLLAKSWIKHAMI